MAQKEISQLKAWFKTGALPTSEQFADAFDSFHHKGEKIPLGDVEELQRALDDRLPLETAQILYDGIVQLWEKVEALESGTRRVHSALAVVPGGKKLRVLIKTDGRVSVVKATCIGTGAIDDGAVEKWSTVTFTPQKVTLALGFTPSKIYTSKATYLGEETIDGDKKSVCYVDFVNRSGTGSVKFYYMIEIQQNSPVLFTSEVVDATNEERQKNNTDEI